MNTASPSGLYGSFGQASYSAAKMGMVAFTESLAKEGAKYNIVVNAIAPTAASRMTQTVFPEEVLQHLSPKWVAPMVAYLTHETTTVSGAIYELGAGFYARVRWEQAQGALLKADESLTPSAVLAAWDKINDFSQPRYPTGLGQTDFYGMLEKSAGFPPNPQGDGKQLDLKGQVAVVTGAGNGLGRAYALLFAKLGARVVVNDVSDPSKVVQEITEAGGQAVGDKHSVDTDGHAIIQSAIDAFGAIHILVNNAGILRDKSFIGMTDDQWAQVQAVHVKGTYACTRAAWPHFYKQKYGRIINTSSASGLYGNFGQVNYATAKLEILGFSQTLALEGSKYNIKVNTIAPNAGTAMTRTIMPEELVQAFKPEYVAPLVALLAHEQVPSSGHVFEVGSGFIARVRLQRSGGYAFPIRDGVCTPEQIRDKFSAIDTFDSRATHPTSSAEAIGPILENAQGGSGSAEPGSGAGSATGGPGSTDALSKAQAKKYAPISYTVTERDVILYNLGIGAKRTDLRWVFEGDTGFEALPSFGVIPQFPAQMQIAYSDFLPNFNPMMILHGEQYLEIARYPLPTSGRLESSVRVLDVLDKGKAASVIAETQTRNEKGELVFRNESTIFVRKAGGFGGHSKGADRGDATAANAPPSRAPDRVVEEITSPDQAAIYRLSGDYNPLHIDPSWKLFDEPILHGLCTFGISCKHIYTTYGRIKNVKVRFASHVFPKETLRTEMWQVAPDRIVFQTRVVERDSVVISAAAARLWKDEEKGGTSLPSSPSSSEATVNVPGFGTSAIMTEAAAMFAALPADEKARKLKKAFGVFQFDVRNAEGKTQSWTVEAKREGRVMLGPVKAPMRADCTLIIDDDKLVAIATGKGNPQKMYMQGQYKVRGNLMKSQVIPQLLAGSPKPKM